MMRLTILGATGRVGRHVLDQALDEGHAVTVLTRSPERIPVEVRSRVRLVIGDPSDRSVLDTAVRGADAVVSALGPRSNTPGQVDALRTAMNATIESMQRLGVQRIVNLSGAGVDAPGDRKPWLDRIASRIVRVFATHVLAAKQAEFDALASSDLAWIAVRPPLVRDGPRTGRYLAGPDALRPGARISRADIADFMLAQAVEPTFIRQAPFIRDP